MEQLDAQPEEIFEINDFTVVTEYERFIVQLESIVHDWGIRGRRPSSESHFDASLKQQSTTVKFKEKEYCLIFYHLESARQLKKEEVAEDDEGTLVYLPTAAREMLRQEFDLRSRDSVFTQYGVLEHLLLEPLHHTIDGQDEWRDIQSAFNVALLNSGCEIPMFVRFGDEKRHLFNGTLMNGNAQTVYEGIYSTDYMKKLGYFSGLVDMFKEKVACEANDLPPVEAVVQFDYVYQNDINGDIPDTQSLEEGLNPTSILDLEFGDTKSAVKKICLFVLWPRLNDETVNETDNFSDLDPYTSPRWLIEMELDGSRKALFSTLDELLDTKEMPSSERRVVHFASVNQKKPEMASALSIITRSHATEASDIGFITTTPSETLQHFINRTICSVFENPPRNVQVAEPSDFQTKCLDELQKSKAAPSDSLSSRISIVLSNCLNSEGGIEKMCTLWMEFVDRLSLRWDNSDNIFGMETGTTPDLGCCLLHQKLQMLQFCIETKQRRHARFDKARETGQGMCSSSSSSDIFFDAEDEAGSSQPKAELFTKEQIPRGRLEAMEECLLAKPGENIYIPQTQDKGPMTDDMIEAHAQHLVSQSSSDRIKEQLDVLLSDMQAFKAANPCAQIEDFIYWHSPRDWSKDENGKVVLSERMTIANNIWLDTWNNARPIPVSSQSRLFNEAKEAHAILQFFKDLTVRELIDIIQPCAFFNAGYVLVAKAKEAESLIADELLQLCRFISKSTRRAFSEDYFDACKKLEPLENKVFWLQSIKDMLDKEISDGGLDQIVDRKLVNEFVLDIARQGGPIRILDAPNGALAMSIRQIMNKAAKLETTAEACEGDELKLPLPYRKHYIFRWLVPRPGLNSRQVPQRMYSCVGERYFHVSGAFTEDSTFM